MEIAALDAERIVQVVVEDAQQVVIQLVLDVQDLQQRKLNTIL